MRLFNVGGTCFIMTPKMKAKEIINAVFEMQHVDDSAKMICLSTPKIAEYIVSEIQKQAENWGVVSVKAYWNQVMDEVRSF